MLLHILVNGLHRYRLPLLPVVFMLGASVLPGLSGVAAPWTPIRRLVAAGLLLAFAASASRALVELSGDPVFRRASDTCRPLPFLVPSGAAAFAAAGERRPT